MIRLWRKEVARDDGWTFIEATLTIVIASIMALGLAITLLAFKEQLDRSMAIRTMDQYANDVLEELTHDLRNATAVRINSGAANTSRVEIDLLDPLRKNDQSQTAFWYADRRQARVWRGNRLVDPYFPPTNIGRGEAYSILAFTVSPFGNIVDEEPWIRFDRPQRTNEFINATYDINLIMRYDRLAVGDHRYSWGFQKRYSNRVYTRNANLLVKKGITGAE